MTFCPYFYVPNQTLAKGRVDNRTIIVEKKFLFIFLNVD